MDSKVRVNHMPRRRAYGARDKERLINTIKELHNKGLSQVEISKALNVSRGTILRWNKELKFFVPRKPGEAGKIKTKIYPYNENYFSTINTPNNTYLVGYILGDGTIVDRGKSKRLVLTLAETDKQLLYDIAKELNMPSAVKFRKTRSTKEQNKYSLPINSTKMCNDLIQLGIKPQKTGKEEWIEFGSEVLQWAFLRGFFDADGHIRVYYRNGYLKTRLGFTGTKCMMQSILGFFKENGIGKNVKSITAKQGCYDLYISSMADVRLIYNKLYKSGTIKLQRKYDKILSLIR
ncbi:LAGLIDADG family homing endonuclease [Neobacillus notoginsengisoli]|uniref:LAGLIDADG family homing endonuclease n=1 Tax=Neobacillus notoginsengisoli TaxID=1578198 RepID=UPI001313F8D3|nr:LAGLIDADG family homing endonuclease [Neobacillus notoginsengisoli]